MSHDPINIVGARAALDKNYVLLLTTNSIERDAVLAVLADSATAVIHRDTKGARIGRISDRLCIHLNGASGAQEQHSIGSLTRWMMTSPQPQPQLIVVVGFAWGNPHLVQEGDIVVASEIRDVNHVRVDKGVQSRRVAPRQSAIGTLDECVTRLPLQADGRRIFSGLLASAELHLSDDDARDAIINQLPEVLGGEMEAFDVVRDLNVPWILIKSVSDYGGDDVDRNRQASAARAAASLIAPMLKALTDEGQLAERRRDSASDRLADALIGHAIHISRPPGDRDAIVDAMNGHVPRLMQRLSSYASDGDGEGLLAETLAVAIVELAQNAFLHGSATHASCTFNETSVTLCDDGFTYDPLNLVGDRGGAQAWKDLDKLFLKTGGVAFTSHATRPRGNTYKFSLILLSSEIREAKRRCRLVDSGPQAGITASAFVYDPGCETLYYEAGSIYSKSKCFSVESELRDLLQAGKTLIIACRDQRQVQMYQNAFTEFSGPRLRIFVGSRL